MTPLHSYAQPPIPRREVPTMREWLERHQEPQPSFWARLWGRFG